MKLKIYYFSGTGNSYIVARDIGKKLNADIYSISKEVDNEKIYIDSEAIGIIFPSYIAPVAGVPLIVERFVKKIINISEIYVFAICTCGGYECVNAIPSLKKLRTIIKLCGGKLSAEYSLRLPMNNLDYDHIPIPITRDSKIIISRSKIKLETIYQRIIHNKGTKHAILKRCFYLLMSPLFMLMRRPVTDTLKQKAKEPLDSKLVYFDLIPLTDKSITINENCKGCGICLQVCPAKNIVMIENRPVFQHKCEMCFACDEWCPSEAIQHWSRSDGVKYHHPEVTLTKFLSL